MAAPGQSLPSAVQLDRRRETAVFLLVGDDHLHGRDSGFLTVASGWLQPPLGVPQPALDSLELAAYQQCPGKVNAEHRPDVDHPVGERLEPGAQLGLLPGPAHGRNRQLDQVRRSLEIFGGQRVVDGRGLLAVLLIPHARPPVQVREPAGLLIQQARLQHVSEKMVVAIPPAPVIQRDHEQVPPVQRLQHGLAALLAGNGITQRAAQPAQDRGLQQEGLDTFGLTRQHLLGQVIDDVAVISREAGNEAADVISPLHRQRRQLKRGDPALGAEADACTPHGAELQPRPAAARERAVNAGIAAETIDDLLLSLQAAKNGHYQWVSMPFFLDLALRKPEAL